MSKTFKAFTLFLLLASCSHQTVNQTLQNDPKTSEQKIISTPSPSIRECVCTEVWMPVCGSNGKTYSNACFAKCAGVNFHQGSCDHVIKD